MTPAAANGARPRDVRPAGPARRGRAGGFTLLELVVGAGLSFLLISGIYVIFDSSRTTFGAGQARVEVQQSARMALEMLAADIRLAGYGFPTDAALLNPQLKITAASPTAITFWADLTNASTTLAADVAAGATTITVASAAGMRTGDTIYLINGGQWQALTVSAVSGTTLTVPSPGAAAGYPQGAQVGRPKTITYSWTSGTLSKDDGEGGGLQPLADGIQAFQLRYFDAWEAEIAPAGLAANLGTIRRVVISITAQASAGVAGPQGITVNSAVQLRNL